MLQWFCYGYEYWVIFSFFQIYANVAIILNSLKIIFEIIKEKNPTHFLLSYYLSWLISYPHFCSLHFDSPDTGH